MLGIQTRDFSDDEFRQVIEMSKELIAKGYFSGINFIQSRCPLPQDSIIIHFLHDNLNYIEKMKNALRQDSYVLPRFTFYFIRREYFKKTDFLDEYKNALFFDSSLKEIDLGGVLEKNEDVMVANKELELLIPLGISSNIESILKRIQKIDYASLERWMDPVIILKTQTKYKKLENFFDKFILTITRKNEGVYTVIAYEKRKAELKEHIQQFPNIMRDYAKFSPVKSIKNLKTILKDTQRQPHCWTSFSSSFFE